MSNGQDAKDLAAQAADAVRRTIAEAEARAERIISDAEAAAMRIRDEAEAEARERIDSATKALEELRANLAAVGNAPAPPAPESEPVAIAPAASEPEPEPLRAEPEVPTSAPTEPHPAAGNGDDAAARLVAMKLAVDGKGREEIEAELTQRFGPGDRSGLLDDVLSRAGR